MDHDDDMRNDSMKDDIHSNDDLGKFMEISLGRDRMDTSTIWTLYGKIITILTTVDKRMMMDLWNVGSWS